MKYKVGDRVRIKSAKRLCKEYGVKKGEAIRLDSFFVEGMWYYCGREFEIKECSQDYEDYKFDKYGYNFNEWMFEDKREVRYLKLKKLYKSVKKT